MCAPVAVPSHLQYCRLGIKAATRSDRRKRKEVTLQDPIDWTIGATNLDCPHPPAESALTALRNCQEKERRREASVESAVKGLEDDGEGRGGDKEREEGTR